MSQAIRHLLTVFNTVEMFQLPCINIQKLFLNKSSVWGPLLSGSPQFPYRRTLRGESKLGSQASISWAGDRRNAYVNSCNRRLHLLGDLDAL